jgi:shikimate dehydrogenase
MSEPGLPPGPPGLPTPAAPALAADLYAVLGNPVAHSRSPFIHARFAAQTGQAVRYDRVLAPLDGFEDAVRAFAAAGGRGCNVTVPFKFAACALAARRSERAELAQAVNVLRLDGPAAGGWFGDNTDGIGLVRDLEGNAGVVLRGCRVLLLGAGGAGAGVLGPLLAARPAELVLANRTPQRAEALVQRHRDWAGRHGARLAAAGLDAPGRGFDVVVNATSSSLGGAAAPVTPGALRPDSLVVDLMYGAAAQPFLDWARAHGARARDGLGMLVEQAAEAFRVWRGVRPDTAPVLAALRAEIEAGR